MRTQILCQVGEEVGEEEKAYIIICYMYLSFDTAGNYDDSIVPRASLKGLLFRRYLKKVHTGIPEGTYIQT